jgi:hypothetical protein
MHWYEDTELWLDGLRLWANDTQLAEIAGQWRLEAEKLEKKPTPNDES